MKPRAGTRPCTAFSLVELVMVVSIIGTLTAIAAPRFSNMATDSKRNSVRAALVSVRKAIDMYYAEHGKYPGYNASTGAPDNNAFFPQLMMFTDTTGQTNATYGAPYLYGPYLRHPAPKNPINQLTTVHVKAMPGSPDPADGSVGWVAVLSHGYFGISASQTDIEDIVGTDADAVNAVKGDQFINK